MKTEDEEFVKKIRELTEELSVVEAADYLKVSKPTIERWLSGTNLPRKIIKEAVIRCVDKRKK